MSLLPDDMLKGSGPTPAGGGASVPPKPPVPPAPPAPPRPPVPPPAPTPNRPIPVPRPAAAPVQQAVRQEAPAFGGSVSGLRVSLMPSEVEGKSPPDLRKRLIALALTLVVETIALGVGYFLLLGVVNGRVKEGADLDGRITQLSSEAKKSEDTLREAATWNAQRVAATEALDGHVRWTGLFSFLESKTLPTVRFLSFSGDAETGTVTLDAVARSYRDAAEQIVVFKNDKTLLDVRTTAASAQVDELGEVTGVSFTMVLRGAPSLWKSQ